MIELHLVTAALFLSMVSVALAVKDICKLRKRIEKIEETLGICQEKSETKNKGDYDENYILDL